MRLAKKKTPYVKQIASPGTMHETDHGMTLTDGMGREVGGGLRMGNIYTHG